MREDQDLSGGWQLTGPAALRQLAGAAGATGPTRAQPEPPAADAEGTNEEVSLGVLGDVDPDREFWSEDGDPRPRSWWRRSRRGDQDDSAPPSPPVATDDEDDEDQEEAEEWDLSGERRRGVWPTALRAAVLGAAGAAVIAVWVLWPSGSGRETEPPAGQLPAASPLVSEQPATLETLPPLPEMSSPLPSVTPSPARPAVRLTRQPTTRPARPRRSAEPTPSRTRSARPTPKSAAPLPDTGPSEAPPVPSAEPVPTTAAEPPYTGPSDPPPVP
ncbi:hypothetical protein ACFV1N_25170 [Streptosporangium canum]|uniref:hypothetical protein n=1 Tax=Streptosporangium canum TaxID=324952 RepID=UPI0036821692